MRPQLWTRIGRLTSAALPVAAVLALSAACNIQIGGGIEAKETWSRTYTPKPGGTLVVKESNGRIRVNVSDEDKIEVTATKVSKASTEEAAKADLKEYEITEKATPDLVEIDSSTRALQVMVHKSRRVDYEIKVPKGLNVTLKTANGAVNVQGVSGVLTIEATNGDIEATDLTGGADVTAVNGRIQVSLAQVHDAGVRCKTTNGQIIVTLPSKAKATLAARVLHGQIETENLPLQATDESRQRLNATIGGGGPEIRVETTNGEVRLVGK